MRRAPRSADAKGITTQQRRLIIHISGTKSRPRRRRRGPLAIFIRTYFRVFLLDWFGCHSGLSLVCRRVADSDDRDAGCKGRKLEMAGGGTGHLNFKKLGFNDDVESVICY